MATVQMPRSFFVKERNTIYSSWGEAFFRELLSNSLDAGAKNIDIDIGAPVPEVSPFIEEGEPVKPPFYEETKVTFKDDGCGMDHSTLEKVYFRLGESTKDTNESIGGFGRARILTNFSMPRYTIYTQSVMARGSGAEYELKSNPYGFTKGCTQEIVVDKEASSLINDVAGVIKSCHLPGVNITVNGANVPAQKEAGKYVRELTDNNETFATLYVNENSLSYIFIRINGMTMFQEYISGNDQYILEVEPSKARQVLVANRDSFKDKYKVTYRALVSEICNNSESVKMPKAFHEFKVYAGEHDWKKSEDKEDGIVKKNSEGSFPTFQDFSMLLREAALSSNAQENFNERGPNVETMVHSASKYLPTVAFGCHTYDEITYKKFEKYRPTNWKFRIVGNDVYWENKAPLKLLFAWRAAVREAVRCLSILQNEEYDWHLGFIFQLSMDACCMEGQAKKFIMLNPLTERNEDKFVLSNRGDRKRLMAFAKHEATHLVHLNHNERYSILHTEIDALYDESKVNTEMVNIKL